MKYVGKLNLSKIGIYADKIITDEVILTEERLYGHILIFHKKDYQLFENYIKDIIENPDIVIKDNRHEDTLIFLKEIYTLDAKARIVIKLALGKDKEHNKNSIITMMRLNKRTWKQVIKNRGEFLWKKLDKNE